MASSKDSMEEGQSKTDPEAKVNTSHSQPAASACLLLLPLCRYTSFFLPSFFLIPLLHLATFLSTHRVVLLTVSACLLAAASN
jgi:hypothetical protein